MNGWRGRRVGLAIAVLGLMATAAAAIAFAANRATAWQLRVSGADDRPVIGVTLSDGRFTLRYRHSVFGTLAEERFAVDPDGRMELITLAADEPAVLDEYYATTRIRPAADTDARRWLAEPATPTKLVQLPIAATEHGGRTLIAGGAEYPLWELVPDGSAVLEVVQAR